tara:strand:+ start:1553 stop:3982 length:2430 start_codon:yes stop_codon:yes gene_type:complete
MHEGIITIFRNIKETEQPFFRSVDAILERIRNGASKDLIKKIRTLKDKSEINELKQKLPAICFSGKFTKRSDGSIASHSGFVCLDFDGYTKQKELLEQKEVLSKNKYVYSVFISPSGKGLKALVKIPQDIDNHRNYFNSLENHFKSEHFDKTSKNISRVCYESYDPLIYINATSSVWTSLEEQTYEELDKYRDRPTIPITDENKIVDILLKWWDKKYPMVEGQRNHNLYVLAAALNDFGVNKSLAEYVTSNYQTKSFPLSEIKRTIDSAYAQSQKFGSRYYEDEEKLFQIKTKLRGGVPKKEIRHQLEESNVDGGIIDSVISRIEEEQSSQKFWTKSDKGTVKIVHILFKQFLEDNGFYKYNPEGSKNYVFVRVTNNLIDHASDKEIKDYILNYLLDLEDALIYNYFADNTRFFREDFLTLLSSIDVYFIADTKKSCYLYYKNCALKVTNQEITSIDYIDLGGYVWKDHVIDRNFDVEEVKHCDFKQFVENISAQDVKRIKSVESTLGFLMHGYKDLSFCPAVIINDEEISADPEGGTGKGLLMNALSQMKKVVVIDGKAFTFERSFAYQLVSADTQILCFDDVKKHFDFERLFSVVTEGLTLEKKNKDAIKIPFDRSPKVAITTNYAIKGSGNSFKRRKWDLELTQYYNKTFTPLDEFKKLMFGDWDDKEWGQFDNYMINCLKSYLTTGLVKSNLVNAKKKKLIQEAGEDFVDWCGVINDASESEYILKLDTREKVYKNDLYHDFIQDYPDYSKGGKMTISRSKFNKNIVAYCDYRTGVDPVDGRDSKGRWIRCRNKHELEKETKFEF